MLSPAGWKPELLPTEAAGHATDLARQAVERGADLILVLGGDGTVNEVVNGMAHSSAVLGVLPGGTANVFAMETRLGPRLGRAAERLIRCVERRVALGRFTNAAGARDFLLMGGVGFDATIVLDVNQELKARAGKLAYWAAGFENTFRRVAQFETRVNGTRKQSGFTLVSRVRNYGGDLEIARRASLLHNDFEVVTFEGSHALRYAGYLVGAGTRSLHLWPGVTTLRTNSVECSADVPVQLDGEYVGRTPGRFEIVPGALNVLLPAAYQ